MNFLFIALLFFSAPLYAASSVCTATVKANGDFFSKWKVSDVNCSGPRRISFDDELYPSVGSALANLTREVIDLNWKLLAVEKSFDFQHELVFQRDDAAADAAEAAAKGERK